MLSDAAIERYSRQILLPEVGGRGQERLGSTTVIVRGDDDAATFATTLLAAAGVRVIAEAASSDEITITLGDATIVGRRATVATLVGRPCAGCFADTTWQAVEADPGAAQAQALGALVAGETLRVALGLAHGGRVQTIDLATGTFQSRSLPATDGCAACAASS